MASSIVSGAIPGLVVLGSIRKQAEQAMRSGPGCLQVPVLLELLSRLLSMNCDSEAALIMVLHHGNSDPN